MNVDRSKQLLKEYFPLIEGSLSAKEGDLYSEALKRMEQLEGIYSKVVKLEDEGARWLEEIKEFCDSSPVKPVNIPSEFWQRDEGRREELEFLTEAFYYFGFRLRNILKSFPGLEKFECIGLRDVRNKLLEHPESRDSQVFVASFASGGKDGPLLKGMRYDYQTDVFVDQGLFVNAKEFQVNLEGLLAAAILKAKSA